MNNRYHLFFGNLANPLKINIITELKKEEKSVVELSKKLKEDQSKISHALTLLRNCSIVKVRREGKKRVYSLNKNTILPILEIIDKHEGKFCNECKAIKFKNKLKNRINRKT